MSESVKVLVIDDDDDIRGLVVTLLERAGMTCHDAPNGREGLREFHAWRPNLAEGAIVVFHDYGNPEFPGVAEAVQEIGLPGEVVGASYAGKAGPRSPQPDTASEKP